VHFVLVNYHGSAALAGYLDSLAAQDRASWRVTVVDNSEDPDEVRRLEELAGRAAGSVEVVTAPGNLGYFGAAEWLLARSGAEPAAWTVVSNMDIRLCGTDFVGGLLAVESGVAVVAPSITSMPGGCPQNPYLITRPSVRSMRRRKLMLSSPLVAQLFGLAAAAVARMRRADSPATTTRRAVYAPHGSVIALHRSFFAAGGSLAHPVFLFNEEINIGEQCRRLGLTVMFEPSLRLIHEEHQATGRVRSRRILQAQADAAEYGYRLIADAVSDSAALNGTVRARST
jgi:GT2 family glycosyltransferase